MSSCWKCGAETLGAETECADGCFQAVEERRAKAQFYEFDFDKLITPEDVREFFQYYRLMGGITQNHPHFDQLKRFLKS